MLLPDISWREKYVSHALNRKFHGVIPVGVYRGFDATAGDDGRVTVQTTESTAVVESNGYSITVTGDGRSETVTVPVGKWQIVVRARYAVGDATSADLLVVDEAAQGDAVVAYATRSQDSGRVTLRAAPKTAILTGSSSASGGLDFGELSIDLGEAGQTFGTEKVDFGEI